MSCRRLALLFCAAVLAACGPSGSSGRKAAKGELPWMTDFEDGLARAKAENKPMLVDFTGSDWCGWCIRLANEVFSQPKFEEYAKEKLVLVELDFPRAATVSAEVQAEREALRQKMRVDGFPTVLVFSPDGKELGRLGYMKGGPDAFISALEALTKK